jgi:hypothetical protein
MDGALRVTFLGAGLLCVAGGLHVYEHGYWEFWCYPVSRTTAGVMRVGGTAMFVGAAAVLLGAALDL